MLAMLSGAPLFIFFHAAPAVGGTISPCRSPYMSKMPVAGNERTPFVGPPRTMPISWKKTFMKIQWNGTISNGFWAPG